MPWPTSGFTFSTAFPTVSSNVIMSVTVLKGVSTGLLSLFSLDVKAVSVVPTVLVVVYFCELDVPGGSYTNTSGYASSVKQPSVGGRSKVIWSSNALSPHFSENFTATRGGTTM